MRGRRPVDWEEEKKKTKRIQRRGLAVSLLSLVIALGMIGGAKMHNPEMAVGRMVLPAISFLFVLFVVVVVLRRIRK